MNKFGRHHLARQAVHGPLVGQRRPVSVPDGQRTQRRANLPARALAHLVHHDVRPPTLGQWKQLLWRG